MMDNAGSIGIGVILGLAIKNAGAVGKVVKDFSNLEKVAAKTKLGVSGLQKELSTLKLNTNLRAHLKSQRKGLQDEFLSLGNIIRGGIAGKTIGSAINFESAMADVRKVMNFDAGDDIKKLSDDILKMTRVLPATAEELAAIAAAGGQIGLGSKDVREFTTLVTKMKVAFDMSAQEVGDNVAKIKNILGISLKEMQDLGDSINHLSDNSASKAKEIIEVMKRTAAAGKQIGFTKEQIAALSSSFISLGKNPEVAGTAINSLYRVLGTADSMGAKASAAFEKIGMSGEFLKQTSIKDPQKALDIFLQRLAMLDKSEQMGVLVDIFGREFADDMGTLIQGLDTYKNALKNAEDEAKKGSLNKEFATRAATTENAIKLMTNAINELSLNLGSVFLPAISKAASGVSWVINGIISLTNLVPGLNGVLGGLIATFLLAKPAVLTYAIIKNYLTSSTLLARATLISTRIHLLAFANSCNIANIAIKAKTITTAVYTTSLKILTFVLGGLNKVFKLVAIGIRILSVAMMSNPIGLILGGIALVAGLIISNWDKVKAWFMSFIEWLRPIWEPIVELFSLVWQNIRDSFCNIFGNMFEWFGEKLSWIIDAISSVNGFIKNGLSLVARFIISNWDKVKAWFMSFIEWLRPIWEPIVELFSLVWQNIGDSFYNIFGNMFEWFGEKLSWISDAISSVSGFINDALSFVGLADDEEKVENSKQEKTLSTQSLTEKTPQILNTNSNFSSGTINVNVSGTFNIATQNGTFNMNDFALAVEKNVLLALKKREQNKANTTIYG